MPVRTFRTPGNRRLKAFLSASIAVLPLLCGVCRADDIARLADEDILQQPLPAPLPRLSILSAVSPPPSEFADLMLAHDQSERRLTTSTLLPPRLPVPKPITLSDEPVDEMLYPADLDIPDAVMRDPFEDAVPPSPAARAALLTQPVIFSWSTTPVVRATVPALTAEDISRIKLAVQAYKRGSVSDGDAHLAAASSPAARRTMEWAALRSLKQTAGFARIVAFLADNPDFPARAWLRSRAEEALFIERPAADTVLGFFKDAAPQTAGGRIALARVLMTTGEAPRAIALVRDAYRDNKTNQTIRTAILKDFPTAITPGDQRYLAERLIYEGEMAEGLRVAATAGPVVMRIAQVLSLSLNENAAAPAMIQKLDPALLNEPAILFARTQALRRAGKFIEASDVLAKAPADPLKIVDGDEWTTERLILARKLLDMGEPQRAYDAVKAHLAESGRSIVDAEVQAGWLALRFLKQPDVAARHFATARAAATAPVSIARSAYWQGRAADAQNDSMAVFHYIAASAHRHAYYGQLALARLGEAHLPAHNPDLNDDALTAAARSDVLQMIRGLIDAEAIDIAQPLIVELANTASRVEPLVALGDLLNQYRLTRLNVVAGKIAMQRGLPLEEHAFTTHGIPQFDPAPRSADAAIVFSIARQESEFNAKAVSHAGARGLMQLMPATARRSAERAGMSFDVNRLTADPAYNVRIGAFHLGELFGEYNGNYLLSFAAYNAGGRRVKEWTTAYGDPRDPNVDKIDWIERIPIGETRLYVQKVLENLQIYRTRLSPSRDLGIASDMTRGARRIKPQITLSLAEPPQVALPTIR